MAPCNLAANISSVLSPGHQLREKVSGRGSEVRGTARWAVLHSKSTCKVKRSKRRRSFALPASRHFRSAGQNRTVENDSKAGISHSATFDHFWVFVHAEKLVKASWSLFWRSARHLTPFFLHWTIFSVAAEATEETALRWTDSAVDRAVKVSVRRQSWRKKGNISRNNRI